MAKSVILLAAGKSSRLWPLNYRHKTMIKIMGKPIVQHVIDELKGQNIEEIIIVSSPRDKGEFEEIGKENEEVNVKVTVQSEPRGMWEAILIGASKSNYDEYIIMNAHQLGVIPILDEIERKNISTDVALSVTKTDKPELFGIVKIVNDKVVDVVEKPPREEAPSDMRIIGVYYFKKKFIEFLESVANEEETEYKLEYALAKYAREKGIDYVSVGYDPLSLRFPWDVFSFQKYIFEKHLKSVVIDYTARVSPWAHIEGPVFIDEGARVLRHTVIKGPAYIGKDVVIGDNTVVRESNLEKNVKVGALFEIARSNMQENSTAHSGYMGDSVIGENTRIGAGFITANVRLDRGNIKVLVKGKKVDSGRRKLGAFVGRNTSIGIHVGIMPGKLIGSNVVIGPGRMIYENVPDDTEVL